jgi:hypothetical protein
MRLVLYPVLQKFYSFSHSLFVQTKLTPYFLQYLLTGKFYHFQRHFVSGDNENRKLFNLINAALIFLHLAFSKLIVAPVVSIYRMPHDKVARLQFSTCRSDIFYGKS